MNPGSTTWRVMADKRDEILACIARHYPLRPLSMSRIYEGCGTRNWSLHAVEGRFFVKEYPGQTNVDEERQALDLAMYARDCGIPTPRVIATCSEDLICRSGDTMHREAVPVTGTDGTSRSSPWGSASSLQHARVKAPLGHVALAQIRRGRQAERNRSLHTDHPTKARAGRLRQKVSTRPCGSDALREPGDCTGDSEVSLGDKRR